MGWERGKVHSKSEATESEGSSNSSNSRGRSRRNGGRQHRGGRGNNNNNVVAGRGAALLSRGSRGETRDGISAAEIKGKDFDFEAGLEKLREIDGNTGGGSQSDANAGADAEDVAYSKSNLVDSFFDSISCEATERAANGGRHAQTGMLRSSKIWRHSVSRVCSVSGLSRSWKSSQPLQQPQW